MKKFLLIICSIFIVLFIIIYTVLFFFDREMSKQAMYLPPLDEYLGLTISTPEIDNVEKIVLYPQENSFAENNGIERGDILVEPDFLSDYGRDIYNARGSSYTFKVKRNNEIIDITFENIPQFEVAEKKFSTFHYLRTGVMFK